MRAAVLVLLAAALPAQAEVLCSWSDRGHDPFRGSVSWAIFNEPSLTTGEKWALWKSYKLGRPTNRLHIWRDGITGERGGVYSPHLTGMRFGRSKRCEEVDRGGWGALDSEPANAWCLPNKCMVIPDVCGNVSFVRQLQAPTGMALAVPEPTSLLLVALAGLALLATSRGRR